MSARDDFEIIKETCQNIEGGAYPNRVVTAAFNRLFAPRPLRDLVADGWRGNAWVKDGGECGSNGYGECPGWSMFSLVNPKVIEGKFLDCDARPILTPEDMGES